MIFATSVSNPPNIKQPPNSEEPIYPDVRMMNGYPPSTIVAPPRLGSIVIFRIVPPVRIACITGWLRKASSTKDKETHSHYVT